ncbi:g9554 [Coccomyxa viridis]|uniref:G9554 protein n=1 Tax=Coccomyxa viridis TaxID=1274662 RepID=A0ABP1G9I1_9CHLO
MPQRGKRIERIAERAATALTNPIVGVRSYRVEQGSWWFTVAHTDGSVAWRELKDMPEDFDRLFWPCNVRASFAVDPAPFPYKRLVNVALDGDNFLIEVMWSKCCEMSWLQADAAAMREAATPV